MQISQSLGPIILRGKFVALEPLTQAHFAPLKDAADDPTLFQFISIDGSKDFARLWDKAMADVASGTRFAFAVRRISDGAIVGSTSYMENVPLHARVEIGWTWYVRDAQGGAVNPECKLLLMQNAFETCGYHRVELKTDSTNLRSRAAILKLGAKEEGVLRGHMWMPQGYWRDTVTFSVLAEEWPKVKAKLETRIADLLR